MNGWRKRLKDYARKEFQEKILRRAILIDINRLEEEPGEGGQIAGLVYAKAEDRFYKRLISNGCILVSGPVFRRCPKIGAMIARKPYQDVLYVRPCKSLRRVLRLFFHDGKFMGNRSEYWEWLEKFRKG